MKDHKVEIIKELQGRCDIQVKYNAEYGTSIDIIGDKKQLKIFVQPDFEDDPKIFVSLEDI